MDRYEALAEECSFDLGIGMSELELIADVLRWQDDKRAAEVCACTADEVKGKGYTHCHYCGKLLPDSLGVVGHSGTGSSKKSVIVSPDE